jgi:hypothetical protein
MISSAPMRDDRSVEVTEYRLTHRIERPIRPTHADAGSDHQVAECVRLVGELPGGADTRRTAGGAQHDLGTFVGSLARHLGVGTSKPLEN